MADDGVVGLAQLRDRLARIKDHAEHLEQPLQYSGEVVAASGRARIEAGGPGWAPNTTGNPLLNRTGGLLAALAPENSVSVADGTATITPAGEYGRIGLWLQEGTGVYGPSGQPITATGGGVLSFMLGGRHVYAHSVKGSPPREFLSITGPLKDLIEEAFARWMLGNPLPEKIT